jgi:prepilin-type N-terminal cleavage/methylation domain-containing protein
MSRRRPHTGFTLVELLVVIGIIAVLIGILLPSLSRAREQGNRVKCAANLHHLGVTSHAFANEHKGIFPVCYKMPDVTLPYRWPAVISNDSSLDDPGPDKWKTYGTPFQTFSDSGMSDKSWHCPSRDDSGVKFYDPAINGTPQWGPVVATSYMYVGGLTTATIGKSIAHWGDVVPAERNNDAQSATRVLAADVVYYSGGSSTKWDKAHGRYEINHRRRDMITRPAFQNILYADGHVDGKGTTYFPENLSGSNYSMLHAGSGVGGYLYWGRSQQDGVITDPPKAPTTTPPGKPGPPPPPPILPTPLP